MEKAANKVIKGIQPGTYFDIHFVVTKLFQDHTNEYYRLVREHPKISQASLVQLLGKAIIDHCANCEYVGQSTSFNIRGNETAVRLFRKIE